MMNLLTNVLAYLVKIITLAVGVVEAVAKLATGILDVPAPTKKQDKLIAMVDEVASAIKKKLYDLSDWLETLGK